MTGTAALAGRDSLMPAGAAAATLITTVPRARLVPTCRIAAAVSTSG
jgi:hypothetical protein